MFLSKSSRRRSGLAAAATAIAAALMVTLAGPASASTPEPSVPTQAEMLDVIKKYSDAHPVADEGPQKDTQIIGGGYASVSNYPYMAQIFAEDWQGRGSFCSGAVVGPRKIMTAAHCVVGKNWKRGVVVTGASHIADSNSLYGGKLFAVSKSWAHPYYNASKIDNDVAVLTLATSTTAKPLPVTTANDWWSYRAGTWGTALGWGRTSSTNQNVSPWLKKVNLPIQSDATCSSYWGGFYIKGHMFCAGKPASGYDSGTNNICNGDSGGPVVVNGRLVGINSWVAKDCVAKGSYAGFVKYSRYANWVAPQLKN
ncbi:S1 family peptidase [Streptomyces sp. NPDC012888]|uniref:S1 family peptidase n=1 Tax=Streptomyces sp. NPDC012888 TaxID=3364855 RepID=UPI00368794A8